MLGAEDLKREARARRRIGLPCRFLDRKALNRRYGIKRPGALCSGGSAEVDPTRLAAEVAA